MLAVCFVLCLAPAKVFWTIDMSGLAPGEAALVNSIQGLANRGGPLVWQSSGGMSRVLIEQMRREGWQERRAAGPWSLLEAFRARIKGYVPVRDDLADLNEAATLAGLRDAAVVPESLLPEAKRRGLAPAPESQAKPNGGLAVEQPTSKAGFLRDYAVKHRARCFWSRDSQERARNLAGLGPAPLVFGWGPDEFEWVRDISRAGGSGVAADWCANLSAMESLGGTVRAAPKPAREPEPQEGERVVAFVLSDGDNVQWLTGGMPLDPAYYANPNRGRFKMTWEASPLLAALAPRVLDYLYAKATPRDGFVAACAPGYSFPHYLPNRRAQAEQARPYLRGSGLRVVGILNANEGSLSDAKEILELPEVDAVLYKDYSPYHRRRGAVWWHKGKPCLAYRFALWEGMEGASPEEVARGIAKLPADPRRDPGSYALVTVHAWSFGKAGGPVDAVRRCVELLPKGTRVVTAPELAGWVRRYFAPKR